MTLPGHEAVEGEGIFPRFTDIKDWSEAELLAVVQKLATRNGWQWMHIESRASRTSRNTIKGPLGPGWPDLFIVRAHRAIAAELKRQKAPAAKTNQTDVLKVLSGVNGIEVYVWRPADIGLIMEVLA